MNRVGRLIVEAGCVWELVALHTDTLPTISQTVHRHRHRPATRVALAVAAAWLAHHLLVERPVAVRVTPLAHTDR